MWSFTEKTDSQADMSKHSVKNPTVVKTSFTQLRKKS